MLLVKSSIHTSVTGFKKHLHNTNPQELNDTISAGAARSSVWRLRPIVKSLCAASCRKFEVIVETTAEQAGLGLNPRLSWPLNLRPAKWEHPSQEPHAHVLR